MALGLVLGALSGGATGAAQSLAESEKFRQQQELEQQRVNMQLAAQKAAEDYKNLPQVRFGNYMKQSATEQVPLEAQKVTTLDRAGAETAGLTQGGITGDVQALRQKYTAMLSDPATTDEQKADISGILDQLDLQEQGQQQLANQAIEGQTRPKNSLEAIQSAIDKAVQAGDAQAADAGRKILADLRVHVGPGGAIVDIPTGTTIFKNNTAEEIASKRIESQERMNAARIAAKQEDFDKKVSAQERMQKLKQDAAAAKASVDPKDVESAAQGIAAYTMKPLGGYALRTPYGQAVITRVRELNPDWDEKNYGAMDKVVKAFAGGKESQTVRSLNVAIDHIDTASKLIDALNNGQINLVNKYGNMLAAQTGSTAPTNFDAVKSIVADEITKSVVGGAGALADREEMAKNIRSSNSPEQIRGVLDQFKHLMAGQLNGLRQQYEVNTGRQDFDKFLLPKTIEAFQGIGYVPSSRSATQGIPANKVQSNIPKGWTVKVE